MIKQFERIKNIIIKSLINKLNLKIKLLYIVVAMIT